jgi:hypothetical protein
MKLRFQFPWVVLLALALTPLLALPSEDEDAHSVGCLPQHSVQNPSLVCAGCHKDSSSRWESNRNRPCTPYCMGCHKKTEMDRHHPVGIELPPAPPEVLLKLTSDNRTACFTCHDLSHPRYDNVRWKAASLFDRLFRPEKRYKTFFLSERNDEGQLCLSCH